MRTLLTRLAFGVSLLTIATQAMPAHADFLITGPTTMTVGQNQTFGVIFTLTNTGTTSLTPGGSPGTSRNPNDGLASMSYLPVTETSTEPTLPALAPGGILTYTFMLQSTSLLNGESSHQVLFNITPYYIDSGSGGVVSHTSPTVTITVTQASAVPEPASLVLSGLGLIASLGVAWGRSRRQAQVAIAA